MHFRPEKNHLILMLLVSIIQFRTEKKLIGIVFFILMVTFD